MFTAEDKPALDFSVFMIHDIFLGFLFQVIIQDAVRPLVEEITLYSVAIAARQFGV